MEVTTSQLLLFLSCILPAIPIVQALRQFDDETYQKLMDDPRAQVETVYTSYAGITAARITSFISSLSSILIVVIIVRSATGLSTSYHRLVFGMSIADTIGSLAIFCSTWLMPTDMIYQQFEGAVYGTASTCTTQGFLFFTGVIGTFAFNTALCIYYASVIRFKIPEEQFQKCVEPILIMLVIVSTLIITVPLMVFDFFVPTPWDFTCTGARYPYWCGAVEWDDMGTQEDSITNDTKLSSNSSSSTSYNDVIYGEHGECEKPKDFLLSLRIWMLAQYFACAIIIIGSMFIVCWTVYVQERSLKRYLSTVHGSNYTGAGISNYHENDDNDGNASISANVNVENRKITITEQYRTETRIILFQALGYLGAFILCQVFPLVSLLNVLRQNVTIFQYFHIVLRPLQGFFNFLIFMGHKVSNKRRADNSLSRWKAFWIVLTSYRDEMEPTLFIGNMTMVVKRGNGEDDDMLDISFSEVRDTSLPTIGAGDRSSTGMFSFDPSTNTNQWNSNSATAEVNHDESHRSETGLSYGATHYSKSSTTRRITDEVASSIAEVFHEDDTSEGLEPASKENSSGILSWYSRKTPKSEDISHAVSTIDS